MRYYKLIDESGYVGVANSFNLLKYQTKHRIMLACDEETAQYVRCEKTQQMYHAMWMVPEHPDLKGKYKTIDVLEITEDEYNLLYEIEDYEEIPEPEDIEPEEIPVDPVTAVTLDYVITQKIKAMRTECRKAITNGFDIVLSDGNAVHFTCTTQDQLNIITLGNLAASGELEAYPYHADGELCRYFTVAEIMEIVSAMQMLIARETTYFNSLKAYIAALTDTAAVADIYYGCAIPTDYQSQVYKDLFGANE